MKIQILMLIPLVSLAGTIQVPGQWKLMPVEAVTIQAAPPAVPRASSGQGSTLGTAVVRVADDAEISELKGFQGVRVDKGEISLVYGKSEKASGFVRMQLSPQGGAEWYESTYWTGGESWARVAENWMHPGNNSDVARTFVAPQDGRLSVSGTVKKLHLSGDGVKVAIRHNDKVIWTAELDGKDGIGKEPEIAADVKKGDKLRFILNRKGSYSCDTTGWDPVIKYEGGQIFRASEGFADKQAANNWCYECTGAATAKASVPELYGIGRDFKLYKNNIDAENLLPVVIVSDGNKEDGFGGYLIIRDTAGKWAFTQNTGGLSVSGPGAAAILRYDGTWIEALNLLAGIVQEDKLSKLSFEKLTASVRSTYDKLVGGVSGAPELDLFLLAVSEWVQDDDLFAGGDAARLTACIKDQTQRLQKLTGKDQKINADSDWMKYLRTRLLKRVALLSDPKLKFKEMLFCKRANPSWNHEVAQYFGWRQRPGGSLYVLERPGISMSCRDIIKDQLPQGNILEPRLSYDGKKILFSFVATDGALDPRNLPRNETDTNHHYYHIYEIGTDGTGLRQITNAIFDDMMPEWLPDGGIAFVSTRRRATSRCFWWGYSDRWHSYTMYRMNADGSNIQQLSWNDVNDWFPAVSNSGHLLFARWDYIDRDAVTHQNLWSMRPDGTNPMAVWGNETPKPHCTFQAKPIPGSSKIVCVASAHHAITGGPLMVIDPAIDNNSQEAVTRLTPGHYPECEGWNVKEWYNAPWPLSDKLFLVSYSRDLLMHEPQRHNPDYALGLYVMDDQGNREILYRDGCIGSTNPTPLAPRKMPPVLSSVFNKQLADQDMGEMFLSDIYEGMPKAERGTIKQIRVVQVFPKTTRDSNTPRIGVAGEENTRAILGVTPVEADGSARFLVPARKAILLQVLDKDGFAYRTMRSSTSLMPGERVSCIGCHENKMTASAASQQIVTAMKRPAAVLTPTPESGRPYGFVENIQPILDAKCISCHNDKKTEGGINLTRTIKENGYTASYQSLCYAKNSKGKNIRRRSKKTNRLLVPCFAQRNQIQVTPEGGADGAIGSGLIQMLKAGHSKVELTAAELLRIGTWIDMNAIFYGVYEPESHLTMQREGKPVPMPEIQ